MFDCAKDLLAFHDDKVTLPQSERTAMRDRRDANRDRVKKGLDVAKKPKPIEFVPQGSYAMLTMVQDDDNNYDIDDGVYFEQGDLKGARGAAMSSLDVRQMLRDAVDDGSFKKPPEVRPNCVRVLYDAGYHVDLPAYRRVVTKEWLGDEKEHFELAGPEWKRSDARDVTAWFDKQNTEKSPDEENGRQMRRMVRYFKKFAKSRSSWADAILSGFGITVLVAECYRANAQREDVALYDTMKAMRDRLELNLVVKHPVTPDATITNGSDDAKARFLRTKLTDALEWLKPLVEAGCTREEALKCWDTVFSTDFFVGRKDLGSKSANGKSILSAGILKSEADEGRPPAVNKQGGGRYA